MPMNPRNQLGRRVAPERTEFYTLEQAKAYVAENLDDIMCSFRESKDVPEWARDSERMQDCWRAGCWLNTVLKDRGATDDEVYNIGFAHGQRSALGDTWKWALAYANEYAASKNTKDKPGVALADQILREIFEQMFTISHDGRSITCLRCGRTSWNPNDVEQHYCGHCHVFHDA